MIDFASDRRAPTPTAAAEMAVPVVSELAAAIANFSGRARDALVRQVDRGEERLGLAAQRWPSPQTLFEPVARRLAEPAGRLPRALAQRAAHARGDLQTTAPRLRAELITQRLSHARQRLADLWRLTELAHPERPLQRGFVRVTDRSGQTVVRSADARSAKLLSLRFGDGVVDVAVEGSRMPPLERDKTNPYLSARKRSATAAQPGLFDDTQGEEGC